MHSAIEVIRSGPAFELLKVTDSEHDFPVHVHRKICAVAIDEGSRILIVDGKKHRLKKDDVCLIPAGAPHGCRVEKGRTVSYTVASADDIDCLTRGIMSAPLLREKFMRPGVDLCTGSCNGTPAIRSHLCNETAADVLRFIDEHYMEKITVDLLAGMVRLSPFHLLHVFKQSVGISLHQYIVQTRVKKFRERIVLDDDILDAGLSCGFYDQSHMIRNFRKHVGTTPKIYRDTVRAV